MRKIILTIFLLLGSFVLAQTCPSKTTAFDEAIIFVGKITSLGNSNEVFVWFEYGENINNLTKTREERKTAPGIFCIKVENLKPCAKYFYRAGIKNQDGINYGQIKDIETRCNLQGKSGNVDVILPSSEIFLNKCSSQKLSFFVVNNTKARRKTNLWIEGEIEKWFKPSSLSFILPAKAKRKINWKIDVPCTISQDSFQVFLKIKSGNDTFNYPIAINLKSEPKLDLKTK